MEETSKDGSIKRRILRVISDMRGLDGVFTERYLAVNKLICGEESIWKCVRVFFQASHYDVVVFNSNTRRLLGFCLLRWLLPFHRCKLVALDIHLSEPVGWRQRLVARLRRLLLRQVDWFILYFTDLEGYERFYGISHSRSSFVPFKVNSWERIPPPAELSADGDYVFTGGRSLRDLSTFVAAMRQVPYPGLMPYEDAASWRKHGTDLDLSDLPSNVRAEYHDGNDNTWIDYIRRAKLVVIPTLPNSIYAPGLSVYLLAMALRKCVIISEGPQTRGLLTDEAIFVPPGDPVALANAICRAWEDDDLRERTADAGRRYAEQLRGEPRLLSDIVDVCGNLVAEKNR